MGAGGTLKKNLKDADDNTNVGDEGGFAPNLKSADEALAVITATTICELLLSM